MSVRLPARFTRLRSLGPVAKVLPILALLACLYLLADRAAHVELAQIGAALGQLAPWQWAGAILLTGLSFTAVGQYDAVIHRVLGTGVTPGRARFAGVRAIALSQTVGFSSLSGGLVRLRCLPELDLWTVSRLSVLVSLSFLGAWAVLAGTVLLAVHGGPVGLIGALLAVSIWQVTRWRPDARLPGLTPRIGAELLVWTAIDTFCAALVLGLLLPPGLMPEVQTLFAAFLVALGAGLLSQSPAGLGAFELALLTMLPQVPDGPLLAAVLAYRVIYFLCPALLALAMLIRPAGRPTPTALHPAQGAARQRALARAPKADWGLAHQGAEVVLTRDQAAGWLLRHTGPCLVAIGQPLGPPDLSALQQLAHRRGLKPVIYKCDPCTAVRARAMGWRVIRVSQEAVIDLARWSVTDARCRQLRRKLRDTAQAGLRIVVDPPILPLVEMAAVSQAWAARNGGEKGFSMGRFSPALLRQQRLVLGYLGDRLVGFVSFHDARAEWGLDLMRSRADAPPGTMHALVHAGLGAAAVAGVAQVSLAAVPCWPGRSAGLCDKVPGVAGLRQFKRSFGPDWRPLYLCAPGPVGLIRSAIAITVAVHWPVVQRKPPPQRGQGGVSPAGAQDHLAYFEFETRPQACDAQRMMTRSPAPARQAGARQMTGPLPHDQPDQNQRPVPPA